MFLILFLALLVFLDVTVLVGGLRGASLDAQSSQYGMGPSEAAFDRTAHPYSAGQFLAVAVGLFLIWPVLMVAYTGVSDLLKRLGVHFDSGRNLWLFALGMTALFAIWAGVSLTVVARWAATGRPYSNYEHASYAWPITEHAIGLLVWGVACGWLATHRPAIAPPKRVRRRSKTTAHLDAEAKDA